MGRDKIPPPPSSITGELGSWLNDLWKVVNFTPTLSYFSAADPNSSVTGLAGDVAINVAPSATTRMWLKQSSITAPNRSSWTWIK